MTTHESAPKKEGVEELPQALTSLGKKFWRSEDLLLALVITMAMAMPVLEMVLRAFKLQGIGGAASLVQHATLWVGMLGGAIAARYGRLLGFAGVTTFLPAGTKLFAEVFAGGICAGLSALLANASWDLVVSERGAGTVLAFGMPTWIAECALPIGFALIAFRVAWLSGPHWQARAASIGLGVATFALGYFWQLGEISLPVWAVLAVVLGAAILGMPIFAILGGTALVLFLGEDTPLATLPIKHYALTTSPTLPTVVLFTLAGYFLAEGGASKRLVGVFEAWFGSLRGGHAVVVALACAFFTSFTGGSGVTILALGSLLLPVLISARIKEQDALGLVTCAGALGLMFPPCLPLILFAIIAGNTMANLDTSAAGFSGISMEQMFLGGIIPGVLLVGLTAWWGIRKSPPLPKDAERPRFDFRTAMRASWDAKWELSLPFVALIALFGGFATPVEAGALTALYALLVEWFVHRSLSLKKDFLRISTECGLLVGGVLLILGTAMGFTYWLINAGVPDAAAEWASAHIHNKWTFLLLLNAFLLIVGCLMDIYSAIVVVVPLIMPVALHFGIDPIHLGIVFLANLELGYLTPPVGMNLFLASYRFNKPISEVLRSVMGIFWWRLAAVLVLTYVPWLSTWLPSLFR